MAELLALQPGATFAEASGAVLDFLHAEEPLVLWAVTYCATEGHEVLDVRDPLDRLRPGQLLDHVDAAADQTVSLPLRARGSEDLGSLWARDLTGSDVQIRRGPLLELLAQLLSTVLTADRAQVATARRSEVLHVQAHSDELTGLPNRRGWTRVLEVEQARYDSTGHGPAVIIIDLDGLKEVNDEQGHVAGDEHLQLAATTLAAAGRESDFVARLGGDEFGVLIAGSGSDSAAEHVVERIRQAFEGAGVVASIGCAHYQPEGGLLSTWWRADHEMYGDKQRRRERREIPPSAPTPAQQRQRPGR